MFLGLEDPLPARLPADSTLCQLSCCIAEGKEEWQIMQLKARTRKLLDKCPFCDVMWKEKQNEESDMQIVGVKCVMQ